MQTPRPLSACAQHPARPTPDAGLRRATCLATALALTACSSVQLKHQVEKSVADNSQNTAQQRSVQADYAQKQAGPVRKVDGFWLGSRAIKLSPDQQLPPVFDQPHSLSLRYPTTLAGVADALTKVSGVMIRIQPDVYTAAPSAAPSAATVRPASGGTISQTERDALFTGYLGADSLRGLLDKIAAQASISWEYRDGLVQFYRLQSRTFTLLLPPGEGDATVNVSKSATATSSGSGSGSNSGSASSSSDNKVSSTAKLQFWSNIERTLKAMLTAAGKAEISQTTGTVSVTDTRDAVERIAEYIERENAALTRQVQVDVKVLSVQTSDNGDLGLDWTAVYQKLTSNGLGNIGWSFGSGSNLTDVTMPKIGVISSRDDANSSRRYDAMFKALNEVGRASLVRSATVLTTNNRPVPVTQVTQTVYLAKTTASSGGSGSNSNGTPGLEPGTVNTGFYMQILPTVLPNKSVLLQFSLDLSRLKAIKQVSSGTQSIEAPEVDTTSFIQSPTVKSGDTLVVMGFESTQGQYSERGLDRTTGILLGGALSARTTRETLVVMITPTVVEGAR